MFNTSIASLRLLASIVWYIGVVVLILKSSALFIAAQQNHASLLLIGLVGFLGIVLGTIKAKYLFGPICIKNLKRINTLQLPKLWQFYRPQFFVFLTMMITFGAYASKAAQGDNLWLLSLAGLELSIATALLLSSRYFFK